MDHRYWEVERKHSRGKENKGEGRGKENKREQKKKWKQPFCEEAEEDG